jgi:hypothetical protein
MAINMKLALDYDVADGITLLTLKDYRKTIKQSLNAHFNKGDYMHPEDVTFNQTKLLPALKLLINHFGG